MLLKKVISGGQTGADQAGLVVARRFGLETGGIMPKGFKTLTGPRPDLASEYGLTEHASDNYVPRTYQNAKDGDGTVRLAGRMDSRGEVCTLKAIQKYGKPHFDVDLSDPPPHRDFVDWLLDHKIQTLNVAGNAEQTYAGAFKLSFAYLVETFFLYGLEMVVKDEDIYRWLGVDPSVSIIYTDHRVPLESLSVRRVGRRP